MPSRTSPRRPSRPLVIGCAVCALAGAAYWLYPRRPQRATPTELADAALHASSKLERDRAAVQLADLGGEAIPELRRVLRETREVDVAAPCLEGLGRGWDYDSMDIMLDIAERGAPEVRGRAAVVIGRMTGRERPYRALDADQDRKLIVRHMRADWDEIRNSPHFDDLKRRLRDSYERRP